MGDGIAGQTGPHVLEDRKQDRGSAWIHLLKMRAAPAWAPLQKHSPVKEGRASSRWQCRGLHTARVCTLGSQAARPTLAPPWG